jgi:hypothetical protein
MSEHEDLNKILFAGGSQPCAVNRATKRLRNASMGMAYDDDPFEDKEEDYLKSYVHWTTADGRLFIPAAKTVPLLTPGVYEIDSSPSIGIYFE